METAHTTWCWREPAKNLEAFKKRPNQGQFFSRMMTVKREFFEEINKMLHPLDFNQETTVL